MIIVLFIISIAVFSLILLIPGDVAAAILGFDANEKDILILREKLGLDKPFHIQYLKWLGNMLRGDFGISFTQQNRRVNDIIADHFPVSATLG